MRFAVSMLAVSLLFACKVKVFDDLEKEAPISSLEPPSGYPRGALGRVMDAYVGENAFGESIARVVAAGGPGSPQVIFNVWNQGELGELNALDTSCNDPGAADDCEPGISGDVVGLESWMGMKDCFLTSAVQLPGGITTAGEGTLRIVCERMGATIRREAVPGVQLGRSLAALPEGHPAGVAIIGAPGANGGQGTLYRLEDGAPSPVTLPMPADLVLEAGATFGDALEAMPLATSATGLENPILVAVGVPGMRRVFVMEVGTNAGVLESRSVGCIDEVDPRRPAEESGGAIAIGDTGMGPAIFVGVSDDLSGVPAALEGSVRSVSLAALRATPGCGSMAASDDATVDTIDCSGVDGVTCSAFGRGIAIGDVNADGFGDLVVGAPLSVVDDKVKGAVVIFPGSATGLGSGRALTPSAVGEGDQFGQDVSMARTGLGTADERAEPVVAAPGKTRLYLLFCTGLDGDAGEAGDRCLPSEM